MKQRALAFSARQRGGSDFDPESSDVGFLVEFLPQDTLRTLDHCFNFKHALSAAHALPVILVEEVAIRGPCFRPAVH